MLLGAARAYTYDTLESIWADLPGGWERSSTLRRALILSALHAYRAARKVTELLYDALGTTALYSNCPLDRLLRDVITLNQHALLQEGMLEVVGGIVVGEPSALPHLL